MLEFHIITTAVYAEDLSNQLEMLGAAAVTWQDAGDQPIYEPKPDQLLVWEDVILSAFFPDMTALSAVEAYLQQQKERQHIKSYDSRETNAQDWEKTTQEQFVPLHFGKRLWICPSWCVPPDSTAVNVIFNAGLAFGTGSHATTSQCLEWLDANIHGGETIVDYGCGSGILAVAALKLGAKNAIAIDHDPQALVACQMNAELNEFPETALHVYLPESLPQQQVDIVLANIVADSLIALAPRLASLVKSNGKIVLSGVKLHQVDAVKAAYAPWFKLVSTVTTGEWVRLENG